MVLSSLQYLTFIISFDSWNNCMIQAQVTRLLLVYMIPLCEAEKGGPYGWRESASLTK